jgi:hypothetical protein
MEVSGEKYERFVNVCRIVWGGIAVGNTAYPFPREICFISPA